MNWPPTGRRSAVSLSHCTLVREDRSAIGVARVPYEFIARNCAVRRKKRTALIAIVNRKNGSYFLLLGASLTRPPPLRYKMSSLLGPFVQSSGYEYELQLLLCVLLARVMLPSNNTFSDIEWSFVCIYMSPHFIF